jgi:hypothetical protein
MTLPKPRSKYYESVNYDDTQKLITNYSNELTEALGFYPIVIKLQVLEEMKKYA